MVEKVFSYVMSPGFLSIHPVPVPVDQGDEEERPPEDEVGHGDHQEHLHPGHALLLHPLDVETDPVCWRNCSFLKTNVINISL